MVGIFDIIKNETGMDLDPDTPVAPTVIVGKDNLTQDQIDTQKTIEQMDQGVDTGSMFSGKITIPHEPSIILRDLQTALENFEQDNPDLVLSDKSKKALKTLQDGGTLHPLVLHGIQGATVGFSDEGYGALSSLFGTKEYQEVAEVLKNGLPNLYGGNPVDISAYDVGAGKMRKKMDEYAEENPKSAFGADFAGSVVSGGAIDKLFKAGKLFQNRPYSSAIGEGMFYGGLAGYGYGEGDATQQGLNVGFGSLIGGGASLGFNALGQGVSFVGNKIVDSLMPQSQKIDTQVKKIIKDSLDRGFSSTDEAFLHYAKLVTGRDFTLDQLDKAKQEILNRGSDKPLQIADLSPETRSLLDTLRLMPSVEAGVAKKWFMDRNKGQMQRLQTDVSSAFGKTGEVFQEISAIKKYRAKEGGDMYKRSFEINVNPRYKHTIDGEKIALQDLFQTPQFQDAFSKAEFLARSKAYAGGKDFLKYSLKPDGKVYVKKTTKVKGKDVTKEVELKDVPTEFLHYMKMGLDESINSYVQKEGYGGSIFNSFLDSKKLFLDIMDTANPQYKKARNFYAGAKGTEDAFLNGINIFNTRMDDLYTKNPNHVENIVLLINRMSRAEQEAFRSGAVRGIMDKLGGLMREGEEVLTGKDFTRYFINDPNKLRMIRATFGNTKEGDKAFNEFVKNIRIESEMFNTYRHLQGSQTAQRTADKANLQFTLDKANRQGLGQLVSQAFTRYGREVDQMTQERITAEVVNRIANQDKKQIVKIFDNLKKRNLDEKVQLISEYIFKTRSALINPFTTGTSAGQYGVDARENIFTNPFPNKVYPRTDITQ